MAAGGGGETDTGYKRRGKINSERGRVSEFQFGGRRREEGKRERGVNDRVALKANEEREE